jgi:predicted dehydrogenase
MKRFVLVGVGSQARWLCRTVFPRMTDVCRCVAAVDVRAENARMAHHIGLLPEDRCGTDLKQVLDENGCDFLFVATRPEHRLPIMEIACDRKLPMLLEKPIADSMADVVRISAMAAEAGMKVSVTMSRRMERAKQTLSMLVRSGAYGDVLYVVGRNAQMRGPNVPWNFQAGNDALMVREISEGAMHEFDTFRDITGSNAKTVYGQWFLAKDPEGRIGSTLLANVEMENGVRCILEHGNGCASARDRWGREYFRVECEKATLILHDDQIRVCRGLDGEETIIRKPLDNASWYGHEKLMADFCVWLDGGPEPPTSLRDHLQCSALTFAAIDSCRTGLPVEVQAFLQHHL